MEDYEFVNGIVDAVLSRLNSNKTELGGIQAVTEKDEHPAFIDNPPEIFVLPIGVGEDKMYSVMGEDHNYHTFPIEIIGAYRYLDNTAVADGLRPTRNYGYICNSLFSGENSIITENAVVVGSTLKVYYWQVADYVAHSFRLTINIKAINT